MELKLFGFIDEVLQELDDRRLNLVQIAEEIEVFFEEFLVSAEKGFLNINSRVKSSKSLKEKIIRNQYYQNSLYFLKSASNFAKIPLQKECHFHSERLYFVCSNQLHLQDYS